MHKTPGRFFTQMQRSRPACLLILAILFTPAIVKAQSPAPAPAQKVIIDTDIGDDIDDVFAVGLMLSSPDVKLLGIMSAWGDTGLRSRMIDRLLCETGREEIPSLTGVPKSANGDAAFSQRAWAAAGIDHPHKDAIPFLLDQIKQSPGEITLLALGPLTNIGAAIDQDPETFRKLKRVVLMGGSVYSGYDDNLGFGKPTKPNAEYNIAMDPKAAQKLFRSGVPIYMMPLDSTQIPFDETKRQLFAGISTPLTDSIQVLMAEYTHNTHRPTPTLYDPVAAAYTLDDKTCPTTALNIEVDDKGFTRVGPGTPNAEACLQPHADAFFKLFMPRLLNQRMVGKHACVAPE